MTVVAWDGRTLAADKRASYGGLNAATNKLYRVKNSIVGGAGDQPLVDLCVAWLRAGAEPEKFPEQLRDIEASCQLLLIEPSGVIKTYSNTAFPQLVLNRFFAIGSGRDFAIAAMYLGKTAREAVEIATLFDSGCGNGVDVLELEPFA